MSVICQNFVQNAWKKDLCSNCFKSLSDHDASCAQGHRTSAKQLVNNTGYISQATTIYQSRGLLNHATWTSLLSERSQDHPNGIFKLENGFHGKHLTISPNGTAEKKPNGTITIPRINGISNGHHHHLNGNHAMTNGILKASKSPSGKNRNCNGTGKGHKVNVGFKEGGVQVIGYGGNDYDSDDSDWELGSPDDAEFPLESLDCTDEDRAISRITRENTEFNSKNDNLLQAGLVASCLQQQNKSEQPQLRAKNTNGCCRDDVAAPENSNSGRKGGVPNVLPVVGRPQLQPAQRREAPPQASVKPMLRDEGQTLSKPAKEELDKEPLETANVKKNSEQQSVEIIHESVIVLVDSAPPTLDKGMTSNNITVTTPSSSQIVTDAKPRPSFLHGTPTREESPPESAIYTPGKADLFVPGSRSSSEEESSNKASSPPFHQRQRSISENDLAQYQSASVSPATATAAASSQRGSKPDHAISDSNLAAARNETLKSPASNSADKAPSSAGSESKESSPASSRVSEPTSQDSPAEEPAVYYAVSNTIVHTEHLRPTAHVATVQPRAPVCHYAESSVYQEARSTETGSNRSSPNNRESKLAALAQELEQARHAGSQKRQAPSPPKVAETSPPPSTVSGSAPPVAPAPVCKQENPYGYASIYGKHGNPPSSQFPASPSKSSSGKTKSATISSVQGKKVLALLNLDENTKANKKGKFSIKKFLKRGKDMESIDTIFQNGSSPNPKAWKQNSDFDRSKLKLEIIHPMDMVGPKEMQSTNPCVTPEGHYASSSPPSLAESSTAGSGILQGGGSVAGDASPRSDYYASSDNTCKNSESTSDGIYDDDSTWQTFAPGGSSPLPTSGSSCAGGDLESCGESTPVLSTFSPTGSTGVCLPSESASSQEPIYGSHRLSTSGKPVRPPKPPPPPRIRPFSPTAGLRDNSPVEEQPKQKPSVPVPKPQVPKRLFRPSSKTDYANLGDVRTPMAPSKPDRTSTSLPPGSKGPYEDENNYEPIDMNHGRSCISSQESVEETSYYESYEDIYQEGSSLGSHLDFPIKQLQGHLLDSPDSPLQPLWRDSDKVTVTVSSHADGGPPPPRGSQGGTSFCGDNSAWLSLEQSYAIVAAANHEVLAKLIGQVVQQKLSVLSKGDGQTLCWADFSLQTTHPLRMLGRDKTVFNALFRQHPSKKEVTLVVTCPPNSLSNQESPSKHLFLACFSDSLPAVACAWDSTTTGNGGVNGEVTQQAMVHVLPRAEISSIRSVFLDTQDKQRPVSFEKEFCFVYLQLIQALKILQAHGTEEVDLNLEHLILSKGEKGHISSLVLFSSDFADGSKVALCQYALRFMLRLLGIENMDYLSTNDSHPNLSQAARKIFITVAKVLNQEKASSLSKAKNLLEFHLWGPREYIYSLLHGTQGVEDTLQRWLDIERAQSLRLLVRSHKNISAYEEQQLQFLVHTSAKILKDLSSSLCFEKL